MAVPPRSAARPRQEPGRDGPSVIPGASPGDVRRATAWLLDAVEHLRELAGVGLLRLGERLEPVGDLGEALLAGGLGEARVHVRVLLGLAGHGRLEVRD